MNLARQTLVTDLIVIHVHSTASEKTGQTGLQRPDMRTIRRKTAVRPFIWGQQKNRYALLTY